MSKNKETEKSVEEEVAVIARCKEHATGCCGGTCAVHTPKRVIAYRDERFMFGFVSGLAIAALAGFILLLNAGVVGNGGADVVANTLAGANAKNMSPQQQVSSIAKALKVKERSFVACMEEGTFKQKVADSAAEAAKAGISGTPYSIITDGTKQVAINDAQPKANIINLLENFDSVVVAEKTVPELHDDDHVQGNADARFTIIEYSDVDCPFCKRFHATMNQIIAERTDVKWVYRHLPLDRLHPDARMKAEASECVASIKGEDAFWSFLNAVVGK